MSEKSCTGCKYALMEDYGYSNYTVEGTLFSCLKQAHPDGEFDRFYGEDHRLQFADKCPSFVEGEPIDVDVDHDEAYATNYEPKPEPWWTHYIEDQERRDLMAKMPEDRL